MARAKALATYTEGEHAMSSLCQAMPLNHLESVADSARDLAAICDAITSSPHDFVNGYAAELAMARLVEVMQRHSATLVPLMQAAAQAMESHTSELAA